MERAASCSPRSALGAASSAAMSASISFSPIIRLRNSAASAGVKAQVGGAQFGQLAAHAQVGQRERWILSGSDDQSIRGGWCSTRKVRA